MINLKEKYTPKKTDKFENVGATTSIMTGTPVHVKASIYYNDLLIRILLECFHRK